MDTDLVTRAQGGDQEAFADLVYAVADRFLAVSHRILGDIDLAEDATQLGKGLPDAQQRLLQRGPEVPPLGAERQTAVG
jgi:hypothetical protein